MGLFDSFSAVYGYGLDIKSLANSGWFSSSGVSSGKKDILSHEDINFLLIQISKQYDFKKYSIYSSSENSLTRLIGLHAYSGNINCVEDSVEVFNRIMIIPIPKVFTGIPKNMGIIFFVLLYLNSMNKDKYTNFSEIMNLNLKRLTWICYMKDVHVSGKNKSDSELNNDFTILGNLFGY